MWTVPPETEESENKQAGAAQARGDGRRGCTPAPSPGTTQPLLEDNIPKRAAGSEQSGAIDVDLTF